MSAAFGAPETLEQYRVVHPFEGVLGDAQNGAFYIKPKGLTVLISNGGGWEHVSVSRRSKMPSYDDMDWVKRKFWGAQACVMQLHVPLSDHINAHPYCLHLWRPTDQEIPRPPGWMVA